jgi:hypothetical protein
LEKTINDSGRTIVKQRTADLVITIRKHSRTTGDILPSNGEHTIFVPTPVYQPTGVNWHGSVTFSAPGVRSWKHKFTGRADRTTSTRGTDELETLSSMLDEVGHHPTPPPEEHKISEGEGFLLYLGGLLLRIFCVHQ